VAIINAWKADGGDASTLITHYFKAGELNYIKSIPKSGNHLRSI
tara:strand:- start:455 stop:586 length:132 start_codon:yes stop_codon:yes gene_type:complete